MYETQINDYGKDKLKNLARYEDLTHYPIIYTWADLHQTAPNRKFILYFAIPDDKGNTFVIPAKWCEDIKLASITPQFVFELNDSALEQLGRVGDFSNKYSYPIIKMWEATNPKEPNKKKFDIYFAILNKEKKVFIVQSTWGRIVLLDKNDKAIYTAE